MSESLKPCPFCGAEPKVISLVEEYGTGADCEREVMIRCDSCAIEICEEYHSDAVAVWNARGPEASQIRELKEALRPFAVAAERFDQTHMQGPLGGPYELMPDSYFTTSIQIGWCRAARKALGLETCRKCGRTNLDNVVCMEC